MRRQGHSQGLSLLLRAQSMIRWTTILGALMLVLLVWTGGTARAADRLDCSPVTSQIACHFEGDRDESPSGQHQGVGHCHTSCSGHQIAAPNIADSLKVGPSILVVPASRQEAGVPGHGPGALLRPPIA